MASINCPKCGSHVDISDADYASIVAQVRTAEFNKDVDDKVSILKSKYDSDKTLENIRHEHELSELQHKHDLDIINAVNDCKAGYEAQLREAMVQVDYYKDLKSRMSTKMVGETLEQHCLIQFNQLRATAFRNAYFEKDNTVVNGSKGDFIYRECDDDGNEIISIMFEMKNEMDSTEHKHKNEDFFKELDKDRQLKKCEYAVLVSLLESDNELYNNGIYDVSYRYDKMYVVRPQFFIPIITLLRNAALNTMTYKKEMLRMQQQVIDVTTFEDDLNDVKKSIGRNYELAVGKVDDIVADIDKTITRLNKIKDELSSFTSNLRIAHNKIDNLTVRKLTNNNPTMQSMFNK